MKTASFTKKIIVIAVLSILIVLSSYWYTHPTHYRFCDKFIIGNTADKIEEKYGKFSRTFKNDATGEISTSAYLVKKADYSFKGSGTPQFYIISFDENDIAYKVSLEAKDWAYNN